MSTHTPGPWVVHPQHAFIVPAAHAARPIGGAEVDAVDLARYAQEIAALHHPDRHRSEGETRANARLLAAAPELLDALQHIADFTAYRDCDNCLEMNAVARAAIAKAMQP